MATARRKTSDPLPSSLESKSQTQYKSAATRSLSVFLIPLRRGGQNANARFLTLAGSRCDLESEEVTLPPGLSLFLPNEEIFVDAQEKEDEEVFLEAIQMSEAG